MPVISDIFALQRMHSFAFKRQNLGLVADVGTLQRLPKLIPEGIVRELALTGRKLEADEAEKFGLISEIFDDHQSMLNHAMDMAKEIGGVVSLSNQWHQRGDQL